MRLSRVWIGVFLVNLCLQLGFGTWTLKHTQPGSKPPPRELSAGVYCSKLELALFTFGRDFTSTIDDAWGLTNDGNWLKWVPVNMTGDIVLPRYGHSISIVADENTHCDIVLFGGHIKLKSNFEVVHGIDMNSQSYFLGRVRMNKSTVSIEWKSFLPSNIGPGPLALHSTVSDASSNSTSIFVYGGISVNSSASNYPLWRLSVHLVDKSIRAEWKRLAPSGPQPPVSVLSSATILGTHIAFFGGQPRSYASSLIQQEPPKPTPVWIYSIQGDQWATGAGGPTPNIPVHYGHIAASHNNTLLVHGGKGLVKQDPGKTFTRPEVRTFKELLATVPMSENPAELCSQKAEENVQWCMHDIEKENDSLCRSYHTGIVIGDKLLAFWGRQGWGCNDFTDKVYNDVWELDMSRAISGNWVVVPIPDDKTVSIYERTVIFFVSLTIFLAIIVGLHRYKRRTLARARATNSKGNESNGLPRDVFSNLPTIVFKMEVEESEEDMFCPICLEDYFDNEELVELPCKHIFHIDCAEEWLSKEDSCPMCKQSVQELLASPIEHEDSKADEKDNNNLSLHIS